MVVIPAKAGIQSLEAMDSASKSALSAAEWVRNDSASYYESQSISSFFFDS